MKQAEKDQTTTTAKIITFILLAGLASWIYFGIDWSASKEDGGSNKYATYFDAYGHAEDFIKPKLKSPGTAEFPGMFEKIDHITEIGENEYQIDSWVDSQNGFGATIRSNFRCIIKFEGDMVHMNDFTFYDPM